MVQITIVAREAGTTAVDFSVEFEVPEVPRPGDYISVCRLDQREPFGEDFIVRHVWWRLFHPATHGYASSEKPSIGKLVEIFVECDPALSPYSSERWRKLLEHERSLGHVEEFQVSRVSPFTQE